MKTTRALEYYVKVDVHQPWLAPYSQESALMTQRQDCQALVDEIKRHCGNVQSAEVVCVAEDLCSHCGGVWTEDDPAYNQCCAADLADYNVRVVSVLGEVPSK